MTRKEFKALGRLIYRASVNGDINQTDAVEAFDRVFSTSRFDWGYKGFLLGIIVGAIIVKLLS